jgi:hypothetical protein
MPNPVVHFDIGCPDLAQSKAFFESVFDWQTEAYGPFSFKLNTGERQGISGMTTSLGHEPKQYVMVYIEVDDVSATLAAIERHGGEIVIPETGAPNGKFAWFKDPSGNMLGLWKSTGA